MGGREGKLEWETIEGVMEKHRMVLVNTTVAEASGPTYYRGGMSRGIGLGLIILLYPT